MDQKHAADSAGKVRMMIADTLSLFPAATVTAYTMTACVLVHAQAETGQKKLAVESIEPVQ